MTNQPDQAWVEAALRAAGDLRVAISAMGDQDLDLELSALESVKGSNSADSDFLDYLAAGDHLKDGTFLANAR
jgi:hypothetical protein